jgi:hypothetical protein
MAKTTSFQVYQDKKGEFRFNLIAKNGEPVAQSSEGYTRPKLLAWALLKKCVSGLPLT